MSRIIDNSQIKFGPVGIEYNDEDSLNIASKEIIDAIFYIRDTIKLNIANKETIKLIMSYVNSEIQEMEALDESGHESISLRTTIDSLYYILSIIENNNGN